MIMVMHWAVKLNRLKTLKESEAISISVDDRKDYRLLRYRCSSTPKAQSPEAPSTLPAWSQVAPNVHEGLLGVFRLGQDVAENTLESHDEDKSKAMANSIEVMLRRACEDPEGVVDQSALDHVLGHIKHFASDQGPSVGKCGKVLASSGRFPRLSYISFDPGHQVRIAMKDPLEAVPEFQQQWERLFGGKDALLPTIQNSDAWRAKLIAAQKKILQVHNSQGGVDKALKTFSFAPQRFDTSASPLLKYCCLIRAIALVCGMQAADATWWKDLSSVLHSLVYLLPQARNSPHVRQKAEQALQDMVAPKLMRAALTCDYSSECLAFLRSNFDVDDPDPALLLDAVHAFQKRMTKLFIKGHILGGAQEGPSPDRPKTVTQLVFEEVQDPEPCHG